MKEIITSDLQDPAVSFQIDLLSWFEHIQEQCRMAQGSDWLLASLKIQWDSTWSVAPDQY
jgi:hypothetical protein